jgi:hypothetical protein
LGSWSDIAYHLLYFKSLSIKTILITSFYLVKVTPDQETYYLGCPATPVDVIQLVKVPLIEEDLVSCEFFRAFHRDSF